MTDNQPIPASLLNELEPAFHLTDSSELILPPGAATRMLESLCHEIARNPQDLRSHVRRILLEFRIGLSDELFAALIDLFLALGDKGLGLRARLLDLSKRRLTPDQYHLLRNRLGEGLRDRDVAGISGSVLASGIRGEMRYVELAERVEATTVEDPLTIARQYLEYSQVDEAIDFLEHAVVEFPEDVRLQHELVEIYRATREQKRFRAMMRKLSDLGVPLLPDWLEAAETFGTANG